MYQEAFQKLKDKDVKEALSYLNPLFEGCDFEPSDTTIMAQETSFYPGFRYLDIADYSSTPPVRRFVIEGKDNNATVLNWNNESIYALNDNAPISLNEDNVADYLRFFLNHVRGKNGRFLIVENIDDIPWRDDPPSAARKSISEILIPVAVKEIGSGSNFILPMTVMFKDTLIKCEAKITPKGQVDIDNEEILVEDIPVLDDTLGQ